MHIYEKKDNKIYIYELSPNSEKLKKYRENEMKSQKNIFWQAKTHSTNRQNPNDYKLFTIVKSGENIDVSKLTDRKLPHSFELYGSSSEVLNNYYMGKYYLSPSFKITKDNKNIQFLIITEDYSTFYEPEIPMYTFYIMDNIISVPKSLYLLQMLEQGNFKHVINEDIDTQLSLFSFNKEPVQIIPIHYLDGLVECKLIEYANDFQSLLEDNQKILRKLR